MTAQIAGLAKELCDSMLGCQLLGLEFNDMIHKVDDEQLVHFVLCHRRTSHLLHWFPYLLDTCLGKLVLIAYHSEELVSLQIIKLTIRFAEFFNLNNNQVICNVGMMNLYK